MGFRGASPCPPLAVAGSPGLGYDGAMSRMLPLLLCLLWLVAACGDAAGSDDKGEGGSGGDPGDDTAWGGPGGPLANAGPDQRLLPGLPGRLDGRGSLRGERGLELRYLWTQESGPRVALDDPTSPVAWFVAPPMPDDTDPRLVFRLTVDDGLQPTSDRVTVELVRSSEELLPAPIALGGADQEVLEGALVGLGPPTLLDPACLLQGGADGCEREAEMRWRWTQVEGPPVYPSPEGRFTAPNREAVLTFRLDAHRPALEDETAACGPGRGPTASALCAAPDYVRVFVRPSGPGVRPERAPEASVLDPDTLAPSGGVARENKLRFTVSCSETAPASPVVRYGYRPLLGDTPFSGMKQQRKLDLVSRLSPPIGELDRRWPGIQAVAYEARARRLHAAPVPIVVSWEFPQGKTLATRVAADPCGEAPCVEGERIALQAAAGDPALTWCWIQTFGPKVAFEEGGSCLKGNPDRHFVAPPVPADGKELILSFLLTVHDGGPLSSLPDTVVLRIQPAGGGSDGPPEGEAPPDDPP